jgi:hypothetical protein
MWWAYIWGIYIQVGLYWGGGAYIWNEVSISICGGLIFGGGPRWYGPSWTKMVWAELVSGPSWPYIWNEC